MVERSDGDLFIHGGEACEKEMKASSITVTTTEPSQCYSYYFQEASTNCIAVMFREPFVEHPRYRVVLIPHHPLLSPNT